MMIAIIRKRIFPADWKKLVFKPDHNGLIITIGGVIPCFFAYYGTHALIKDEIIAFAVDVPCRHNWVIPVYKKT